MVSSQPSDSEYETERTLKEVKLFGSNDCKGSINNLRRRSSVNLQVEIPNKATRIRELRVLNDNQN